MAERTETDVSRPSALPSAKLTNRNRETRPFADLKSDEYLDSVEEEWNKRVDAEVDTLVEGMVDLVSLASIGDKDKFRIALEAFQAESRAESMVRSANSLLSIIHSMKLLLLLSDEAQIANLRDSELKIIQEEKDEAKKKVAELLNDLLKPSELRV
ncbi:hypothetical protein GLOTRDRAFT_78346 [Gloeophyllum trabeum ATCC 11539]|uniref:Mediator of RNA polymerase II transcription subunit 22 n=1 Tax=Gloeophyllum trabeum (strain ATCC 11539 / FP-39264 / Madison 617) TaxID=670483 RepID=S7RNK0_GLOTA|nr:uncharacterized protein GLOTRDRAFT_78346 [Gloeophyllum trabeum ATCC 11539]EPQ54344.1 hypothetical protein GLOTRDRAFT_78346 [Gloeophyllum trabeum ATCC 11539]